MLCNIDHLKLNCALGDISWLKPSASLARSLREKVGAVLHDQVTRVLPGFKLNDRRYDIAVKHYTDSGHRFTEVMLVFSDVTNRFTETEQALGDFQRREQVLSLLETGVIYADVNGLIKYVNPEALRFLDPAKEVHLGEHLDRLLYVYPEVASKFPEAGLFQKLTDPTFGFGELQKRPLLVKSESGNRSIRINTSPAKEGETVSAWLFEIRDVTEETELSFRIEYSACHDPVTGLANRVALEDYLLKRLPGQVGQLPLVYALIDLDNFKSLNDIAGHVTGDDALKKSAQAMERCIRSGDMLARMGGDEFVLVLEGVTRKETEQVLQKILQEIDNLDVSTEEGLFNMSASIGWCYLPPEKEISSSVLYSHADEAMYQAKRSGGNTLQYFDVEGQVDVHSVAALTLEKVKHAMRNDLLTFCFQPIINLAHPEHRYFELLVRLREADRLVTPNEFLPAIERYNYTRQFDRYVFRKALEEINVLCTHASLPMEFAINLSASAIEYRDIFDVLADFPKIIGSRTIRLTLEITETAAIRDLNNAKRFIERVHRLGMKVALDDFGVGFNGYHYLKQLNVDTVKVDGSFISGILESEVDRIFVNSVIDLSKVLNFKTVAEFVDREEKLAEVKAAGFDFSQGYLHAAPMDLAALQSYLDQPLEKKKKGV